MDHGEAWRKFGLRPRELEIISGVVAGYAPSWPSPRLCCCVDPLNLWE
jgi:hypothetical protein